MKFTRITTKSVGKLQKWKKIAKAKSWGEVIWFQQIQVTCRIFLFHLFGIVQYRNGQQNRDKAKLSMNQILYDIKKSITTIIAVVDKNNDNESCHTCMFLRALFDHQAIFFNL